MLARMQKACATYDELPTCLNQTSEQPAWPWSAMQALVDPVTPAPLSLYPAGLPETGSGCLVVSLAKAVEYSEPALHAALLNRCARAGGGPWRLLSAHNLLRLLAVGRPSPVGWCSSAPAAATRQLRSLVASLSAVQLGGIQIPPGRQGPQQLFLIVLSEQLFATAVGNNFT